MPNIIVTFPTTTTINQCHYHAVSIRVMHHPAFPQNFGGRPLRLLLRHDDPHQWNVLKESQIQNHPLVREFMVADRRFIQRVVFGAGRRGDFDARIAADSHRGARRRSRRLVLSARSQPWIVHAAFWKNWKHSVILIDSCDFSRKPWDREDQLLIFGESAFRRYDLSDAAELWICFHHIAVIFYFIHGIQLRNTHFTTSMLRILAIYMNCWVVDAFR